MCRYTAILGPDNPQHASYPSYNGDRILVGKFAYELADPQRWDVIVFKFPGDATTDARTNFIKRLVGLPGETVRIQHGDMWIRRGRGAVPDRAEAAGKAAGHAPAGVRQRLHAADRRIRLARPLAAGTVGRRQHGRRVEFRRLCDVPHRRHGRRRELASLPPSRAVLPAVASRPRRAASSPQNLTPQLITDFTAYNTARTARTPTTPRRTPTVWACIGWATWRCAARRTWKASKGELVFELRKGGRQFQCRLDVATGRATLSISGRDMEQFRPDGGHQRPRPGPARNPLLQLRQRAAAVGRRQRGAVRCAHDLRRSGQHAARARATCLPVGVASVGAKARLSHLAIFRDIYYIADLSYAEHQRFAADDSRLFPGEPRRRQRC